MRQEHCVRAFHRERERSDQNNAGHENGREWFGFAVTVRMGRIWRTRGETQAAPNYN